MVEKVERRESSTESDSSVSNCDLTCQHSGKRNESVTVIEPVQNGMWLGVIESIKYSDLLSFWIWRNIKVRYAQSSLGVGWAIIQPLFTMLIFTLVFGRLAKLDSDGVPYAIFSSAALVPWTFFSNSVSETTGSLIQNANMISKIYFPRLILPLVISPKFEP